MNLYHTCLNFFQALVIQNYDYKTNRLDTILSVKVDINCLHSIISGSLCFLILLSQLFQFYLLCYICGYSQQMWIISNITFFQKIYFILLSFSWKYVLYTSLLVQKLHPCSKDTSKTYKSAFHSGHLSCNMSYGSTATIWIFCLPWQRYSYSTWSSMMELLLSMSQHWNLHLGW